MEDPDKMGLRLVAAYPKALRINKASKEYKLKGPQEVLYFFEVTQKHEVTQKAI